MRYCRVFKSGNTHRITIPRSIIHGLRLHTGDIISLNHVRDGVVEMRNATYDARMAMIDKKTAWK